MRLRWFRTAFWTLIACIGITSLLALRAPVQAGPGDFGPRESRLVTWPNGHEHVRDVGPSYPDEQAEERSAALADRVGVLEERLASLDEEWRNYSPPQPVDHSGAIAALQRKDAELVRADAELSGRIDRSNREIDAVHAELHAHMEEPHPEPVATPAPEVTNTLLFLSIPIPVSGPPVWVEPDRPTPVVESPIDDPNYEKRTETISVQRTVESPPHPACVPCWVGPCPRCGRYHSVVDRSHWSSR